MASKSDEKRVTIVIDKNLDLSQNGTVKLWKKQLIYGLMKILMRILNSFINFNHYIIYYAFNRFYKRDSRE